MLRVELFGFVACCVPVPRIIACFVPVHRHTFIYQTQKVCTQTPALPEKKKKERKKERKHTHTSEDAHSTGCRFQEAH
jgi:hypothetical protein